MLLCSGSSILDEFEKCAAVLAFEFGLKRLESSNGSFRCFRLFVGHVGLRGRGLVTVMLAWRGTIMLGNFYSIVFETIGAMAG
jgi:hypothetical protein